MEEGTDCFRVFHGAGEGLPGLALDRYGELALVQVFRPEVQVQLPAWEVLHRWCREQLATAALVAWRRQSGRKEVLYCSHDPGEYRAREMGQQFCIESHGAGQDPQLFLDMRVARRYLRQNCQGARVLNLFSYTCAAGLAAEAGGASEVLNVDFSSTALERGRRNAELNGCCRQQFLCQEFYPAVWQMAGRKLPARARGRKDLVRLAARQFDLVFLDPPARSKGFFGAVDVKNDYAGLLKPCLELLAPGGRVVACNNLAAVSGPAFEAELRRCATKAGRPMGQLARLVPEPDFPGWDADPPLKIWIAPLASANPGAAAPGPGPVH